MRIVSPRRTVLASCLVPLICLLVQAPPADAAPDEGLTRAKAAFSRGQKLYLEKQYTQAAEAFSEAHRAKAIPAFLFNAAVAYEKAKAYRKALSYFRRYLASAPKASDAAEIRERIRALDKAVSDAAPRRVAPPPRRVEPPPRRGETPPRRVVEPPPRQREPPPRTRAVVVPVLPRIRPKGVVVVTTKPQGANLYLNDKMHKLGRSPWEGSLKTGQHTLIIEAKGYKPERKTIQVSPDRLVDVYVALSQEHYLGWVQITAGRPGTLIYIDDKTVGAVGRTPYTGFLKPGKHRIWVGKTGYKEQSRSVEIVSGETHRMHFKLAPVNHGWLTVQGKNAYGAEVRIDGKLVCKVPCGKVVVKPGSHKLVIRRDGYKPVTHKLKTHRLRHTTARVKLRKKPSRVSAYIAYGVAAGFLAGGITLGFLSKQQEDELAKEIKDDQNLVSSADPRFQKGRVYSWVANGLFGLAGVAAIFGIYYTFADRGPKSSIQLYGKQVTVVPTLGPRFAGVSGEIRF